MFKYLSLAILLLNAQTCNQDSNNKTNEAKLEEKTMIVKEPTMQLHDIWVLKTILEEEINEEQFPKGYPSLEIQLAERSISGFGGCNRYFSSIEAIDEQQIQFGNVSATKMYCMDVPEALYLDLLTHSNRYKIEKLHLYLYQDELLVLSFRKVD